MLNLNFQEKLSCCHIIIHILFHFRYEIYILISAQGPADILTFYVDESEMMNRKSKPVVLFSLHSPLQFENPFEKGIVLDGGRTYKIYVEMVSTLFISRQDDKF